MDRCLFADDCRECGFYNVCEDLNNLPSNLRKEKLRKLGEN